MPGKPSPAEMLAGGVNMMQAVHAVTEMATAPAHRENELSGRFRVLCRVNDNAEVTAPAGYQQRTFRLTLIRLVYAAVHTVRRPTKRDSKVDPHLILIELTRNQPAEVQKLVYAANEARSLPDFLRAVDYGVDVDDENGPASSFDLGTAAVIVLRDSMTGVTDPLRHWMKMAEVTNQVIAKHYLG